MSECLLRRLGVDPDVAVAAIRASVKPVLTPAAPKATLNVVAVNPQLQQPHLSNGPCAGQPNAEVSQQAPPLQPVAVAQLVPVAPDPVQADPPGGASSF